jgi:hypothetical protein
MGLIALAAIAAFAVLVFVGRGYSLQARQWRLVSGVVSIALFVVGGFFCLRGAWPIGLILTVVGGLTALSARTIPMFGSPPRPAGGGEMSESEARSLLGVGEAATRAEIEAAYLRVMKRAHPDQGGTSGLAAKVNAARERLLRKSR